MNVEDKIIKKAKQYIDELFISPSNMPYIDSSSPIYWYEGFYYRIRFQVDYVQIYLIVMKWSNSKVNSYLVSRTPSGIYVEFSNEDLQKHYRIISKTSKIQKVLWKNGVPLDRQYDILKEIDEHIRSVVVLQGI